MFRNAILGIGLGVVLISAQGFYSTMTTLTKYNFSTSYPSLSQEKLKMTLQHGRIKEQLVVYDKEQKIILTKQLNGWFFRLFDHYYVLGMQGNGANQEHYLKFKSFYIETLTSGNSLLIRDHRGIYRGKSGEIVPLNNLMQGQQIS
ncbi:TPA: hypothetical protein ACX6R4_000221 [Photobacterium damselae]|uniref:hypothetical protein n=1 Tax=Photobacterium damselae TaxID=38293 RepID=UPI001EDD2536|nr:hypothetical protein [Photobacterium damselae]MCG3824376.1 hypothetical protein [Photobacterium damselae]